MYRVSSLSGGHHPEPVDVSHSPAAISAGRQSVFPVPHGVLSTLHQVP